MNQTHPATYQTGPRPDLSRSTRKSIAAAQKLMADRATAIDQANVFAGPNPTLVGIVLASLYLAVFLATRINAVLLFVPLANFIRQPRNLVLADRGLALFRSSFFNRPTELVGTYAASDLTTREGETWLGFAKLHLGGGHVWVRTKDRDRLLAAGGG